MSGDGNREFVESLLFRYPPTRTTWDRRAAEAIHSLLAEVERLRKDEADWRAVFDQNNAYRVEIQRLRAALRNLYDATDPGVGMPSRSRDFIEARGAAGRLLNSNPAAP